ncbi:hypothetical protein LUZ63_011184 [Rhynchospora breviuscula]|uniref:Clathrin light chain n=1 Tax=Rhynchospora breviuscula TaxID=2022672 RepID=A0A9Q0CIC6_9POAL|nr:hypothetical protein LUZ63_011184 [Rhynchospora breviuscula]
MATFDSFSRDDDEYLRFDSSFSSAVAGEDEEAVHISDEMSGPHVSGQGSFPPSPEPEYGYGSDPIGMPGLNGGDGENDGGVFVSDGEDTGPVLPPPTEMQPEPGSALREWRRQNALVLEEKEKREKELRNQIIAEAEEYKKAFYEKRILNVETNKVHNREKEKIFVANQEKFHANADKHYWKSISELIPHEIVNIDKKRGKKDKEKKPSVVVIQGPKPGKPTDLARMRQILVKLKHSLPPHMNLPPPPSPLDAAKDGGNKGAPSKEGSPPVKEQPAKDSEKTSTS